MRYTGGMKAVLALLLFISLPLVAQAAAPTVEPSDPIKSYIAKISPQIAEALTPAFNTIDTARVKAVAALEEATVWSKSKIGTGVASGSSFTISTVWTILATIALYILTILSYIIVHVTYFYIALVLAFLFLILRILRR